MTEVVRCTGLDCSKITNSTLKCPMCLKQGVVSVFCDQKCFKSNWATHKFVHKKPGQDTYDPFPTFPYTGKLRACYPLSPRRHVPEHIRRPDHAMNGAPLGEIKNARRTIDVLSPEDIKKMKVANKLGREVLDIGAAAIKPGITTDEIDRIIHEATIARNAYPSPFNYYHFPKSCCTSVNEVICHGIPDQRPLEDGDILNIDVSLYYDGFHSDLNETYYVGDKAKADPDLVRLVETTRESLDMAIAIVKPGMLFRDIGAVVEKHATENKLGVVRTFVGHGVNSLFHCAPDIPHYKKNKTPGIAKPGMTFTIEPMLTLGDYRDVQWPDDWTATTADGKPSAQFEHTLLVTETGCEVLTARTPNSPGGPIPRI